MLSPSAITAGDDELFKMMQMQGTEALLNDYAMDYVLCLLVAR